MERENSVTLPARLDAIGRIAPFVQQFFADCGIPQDMVPRFTLALEELLANVANHGCPPGSDPTVTIRLVSSFGYVQAEFSDGGVEYNPLDRPDPVLSDNVEERPVGGLGVYLIRQMMDHVDYRREGDRNHLRFGAGLA